MTSTLTARWPKFDFAKTEVVWSGNPECAMVWNAMSTSAPMVEPWLNKVMLQARKSIDPENIAVREDIREFVRQESNHYKMHIEYNRELAKAGFVAPPEIGEKLKKELDDILQNRSLAFNAAYCAGFENFTLFTSRFMFEHAQDLFQGGDLGGADLWLWHMAEEYEHRSVCHDVFKTVSGNYFMRIYGLFYSYFHLMAHTGSIVKAFMEKYREGMSDAERAESVKREKAYIRRYSLFFYPRMLKILIPFYNPGKETAPRLEQALAHYSALSA